MFKTYDRIRETTTSTGTGNLTLSAYAGNYLRFSDVYLENTRFPYAIIDSTVYETGIGYLNGSNELVRETVLSSTSFVNTLGTVVYSAVSFPAGTTKDVFVPNPSRLASTINAVPTDDYTSNQVLVYGLNGTLDGWEWQLKYLNATGMLPNDGTFPDNRIIFIDNNALSVDDNLQFDPDTAIATITGDLIVNGNIKAQTKLFSIPHPTEPNKILNHGSLEGPEFGIYFRKTLEIKTKCEFEIPNYFINMSNNYDVFLTSQDGTRVKWKIFNEKMTITRGWWNIFNPTRISVMIIGSRTDCRFVLEE